MRIVHVASELAPIAKVGGLADVLLGLSREQIKQGHHVDLFIPKYDCFSDFGTSKFQQKGDPFPSFYGNNWHSTKVHFGLVGDLPVHFVDPEHPDRFFARGNFYGFPDDDKRFLFFARAVLEYLKRQETTPDVIHIHDWHASLIPLLLKEVYKNEKISRAKTVLTVHNMSYQGVAPAERLDEIGIPSEKYRHWNELEDPDQHGKINFLKGGIAYADAITTVSPTYAQEILSPEGGCRLDPILRYHQKKLRGILNGIDHDAWNPNNDPYLHPLKGKEAYKRALKEALHLAEGKKPIVSCISRLVPQKGLHLIKRAIFRTLEKGGQFVLLGSSPDPAIQASFESMKKALSHNPDVYFFLRPDEKLSHLIFAGSDMMVVPSIFEPCGLTQLIALRYGTIPIVRTTGGLADTVEDIDYSKLPLEKRNGYRFDTPDQAGIDSALDRALDCWFEDPKKWDDLKNRALKHDSSWKLPALSYDKVYHSLY